MPFIWNQDGKPSSFASLQSLCPSRTGFCAFRKVWQHSTAWVKTTSGSDTRKPCVEPTTNADLMLAVRLTLVGLSSVSPSLFPVLYYLLYETAVLTTSKAIHGARGREGKGSFWMLFHSSQTRLLKCHWCELATSISLTKWPQCLKR